MTIHDDLETTVTDMIGEILGRYDAHVPESGSFPDLRVSRKYHFGDPDLSRPGLVEMIVMNMNAKLDPEFDKKRFISVRVMKSRAAGYASNSCLHGTRDELRKRLESLSRNPGYLVDRIMELSHGLPEETNPDIWR
ncbi:MAG: hypothetical protein K1X53_14325 [Candidatus Sumerlaeaceae bacterium]|nr:hypothetical protein [Candidatus Sumerlaeaceae bacterium]